MYNINLATLYKVLSSFLLFFCKARYSCIKIDFIFCNFVILLKTIPVFLLFLPEIPIFFFYFFAF